MVIDESSKNEHTLTCHYGHSHIGHDATLTAPFIHNEQYSLVAAMSKTSYLASCVVPESLDSYEFFDFIVEEVVSTSLVYHGWRNPCNSSSGPCHEAIPRPTQCPHHG